MRVITVNASKSYDILIGSGLIDIVGGILTQTFEPCKVAVITDDVVDEIYGESVMQSLEENGYDARKFVFKNGEKSKNINTFNDIQNFLAKNELTRKDIVLALGGGVVGDVAGFSASTYLRGINYVQVPTTILAQIDSSVGGKTAIDLECGKNLVGAFHQPSLVVCDIEALSTLTDEVIEDGLGEGAKYALLDKRVFMHVLNKNFDLETFVSLCIEYKKKIVEGDEFESGNRKLLNLGHTVGHAIEKLSNYTISHGKAVAIGLDYILSASVKNGKITKDDYEKIKVVLSHLTSSVDKSLCPFDIKDIVNTMIYDKKRDGDSISLVVYNGIGNCEIESIKLDDLLGYFS